MRNYFRYFLILSLFLMMNERLSAQNDSATRADSIRFYKRIQDFSDERRFTQFLHRLIFRHVQSDDVYVASVKQKEVKKLYFTSFEGKVIRDIYIETLDPFGYSPRDTSLGPQNYLERTGNFLHIKTFPLTIRNRLVVKENDTFDSLRVRESMRLIRSQNYIREISLVPVLVPGKDSVDLYIKTYDVWSLIATGSASKNAFRINVKDKNFGGLGHLAQNDYSLDHATGNFTNSSDYVFSNILNSYVNSTFHYDTNKKKDYNASCSFDRPFYSIFTKWAAGAYVLQHFNTLELYDSDSVKFNQAIRSLTQDYWIGKSWQLVKGKSENERTTSFILSGRMYKLDFYEKIQESLDTANVYSNETFFLTAAGITKRKYRPDSFIFKFGFTEDVPIGRAFSFIGGYQIRNNANRWYVGAKTYWGEYYRWGYFSSNLEYGTFLNPLGPNESCISGGINYFTEILKLGRWKLRQFIKPHMTVGFNRKKTDNLSLNNEYGIKGFNSIGVTGTQKMVLVLQTQLYAPWNLIGFRFGPYLVCSFAMLGNESSGFKRSPVYSQFGFGMLIKNDFLIMNSFEISVAYFPYIPGIGNNVVKPNAFRTSDFGFRDSDVGKPATTTYR